MRKEIEEVYDIVYIKVTPINVLLKGAGNAVFEQCIRYAAEHGAKKLFIISNSGLKAALHIYFKYGFKEIKLKDYEYERGDIAFELVLNQQQNKSVQ